MKKILFSIISAFFMTGVVLITQRAASADDFFKVTSIDVGKGDCILIQTGAEDDPVNVLIDTGYKETAKDVLKYLQAHNVKKLDTLIISHFHKDHVGGAAKILREIPVSIVYMPDYVSTKKVYEEMMAVLKESGGAIPYERLKENKTFRLGDAEYNIYPSRIEFDGDNDNNVSMAICLEYKGHTALFAGDLEYDGIRQFLDNNDIPEHYYDILKLPHHGAEEDNTGELVARLKPNGITVITDGQDKRAHGTLLDKLKDGGFKTYCSADDGAVIITAAEEGYTVEKSKNPDYNIEGDWLYTAKDGSAVITGYTGDGTEITIPSEAGGYPVRSIGDSAFYNHKNIKSVTIPAGVGSIGSSAFSWCTSLKDVNIPDSVTTIGGAAFSWCKALKSIAIPDSVLSIGTSGFERCTKLKSIKLSNGLTEIAPSLFEHCKDLESIEIPAGVKSIGKDAFKRCESLTEVIIPQNVTLIDEGAFKRCEGLESITIPEGVQTIGESAFERCIKLKTVKIPDSVTSLEKSAFKRCESLESAVIGKSINTIKKSAFSGCTNLKSVTIPVSVESIKGEVFQNCGNLTDIWYGGTTGQWEAVGKDQDWNTGTPENMAVHCTDPEPGPEPEPEPDPDPEPKPEPYPGMRFFSMPELPGTGFSAGHPKTLGSMPKDLRYQSSGFTLQIPSLDMAEEIVTIPFRNGEYPVEWINNNIGLPEEFALPGSGSAILVGHNHLNTTEAGPFALLRTLSENTRVFITGKDNNIMIFSVFANEKIAADDMAEAEKLSASCENSLVLITCEDERPEGGYASRRIVAAKPVFYGE